ncbi:hypothetical protein N9M16_04015 [Candidatus Dependentiae bacterium]|nr:hypothetical protein [Candidatus Dependentiae bacterium]
MGCFALRIRDSGGGEFIFITVLEISMTIVWAIGLMTSCFSF